MNTSVWRNHWHWRGPAHWAGLASALFLCLPVDAQVTRAGVELPSKLQVGGDTLALTSCGVRDTLWIEHYVAALYLRPGRPVADSLRDPQESKAILMQVLRAASLPERIPPEWREPLGDELEHDPLTQVRAAYKGLGVGDRVRVSYAPGEGVTIRVNGNKVVGTPGHGLIGAMLRTWSGKDPLSGKLQRLLLEHPC